MAAHKTIPADIYHVNTRKDYEVRYWSEKFNVSNDELESAVRKVGVKVDDVVRELEKSRI